MGLGLATEVLTSHKHENRQHRKTSTPGISPARKSKSAGTDDPEGVGWSSLHEIYIGYEVGYTSGGIRFAAKGTAKPAEQGTTRPGRVPGIPHQETDNKGGLG